MSYQLGGEQQPQIIIDIEKVNNLCFENIFLHLDMKTLRNCMLTCHRFKNLISNGTFWVKRARIMGRVNTLPPLEWRKAAYKRAYQGNESGEIDVSNFKFNFPKMIHKGGYSKIPSALFSYFDAAPDHIVKRTVESDEYMILTENGIRMEEGSGYGCEHHPAVEKCLAFARGMSTIYIFVDLVAKGIDPWILDYVRPKIRISQKMNHRHDCKARLLHAAQLNYKTKEWVVRNEQVPCDTDFKRSKRIDKEWSQWTEATWTDVALEFDDYSSGMRHLTVMYTGYGDYHREEFYGPISKFK